MWLQVCLNTRNMRVKLLFQALLLIWEFLLFTLAHVNKDNAGIDLYQVAGSLEANQSRYSLLRFAGASEISPKQIRKTATLSNDPVEELSESSFKRHTCWTTHNWDSKLVKDDLEQTRHKSPKQQEFQDILGGSKSVTWQHLKSKNLCFSIFVTYKMTAM